MELRLFEKITLRAGDRDRPELTFGRIVEALVFYQRVHLLLDLGQVRSLVEALGTDGFLELLARPEITCTYVPEFLAVHTDHSGGIDVHRFIAAQLHGHKKLLPPLQALTYKLNLEGAKARKFEKSFRDKCELTSLDGNNFVRGGITNQTRKEFSNQQAMSEAMNEILRQKSNLDLNTPYNFEATAVEDGFLFTSGIDWREFNQRAALANPGLGELNNARLLTAFNAAIADVIIASHYGADYVCSPTSSAIMRMKFEALLKHAGREQEEIEAFKSLVLDELPSIQEVVDGSRDFSEAMKLVDQSAKFKKYVGQISPDASLVKDYLNEVARSGKTESFPAKAMRFLMCTTAGLINPAAGAGLSATDALFGDRVGRGWRPHHFIDRRLKPFLSDQWTSC